jgi:acetyl esterase/lipase
MPTEEGGGIGIFLLRIQNRRTGAAPMKKIYFELWNPEEYKYPMAFGFLPNVRGYLHEEDEMIRPCILIAPGGGYFLVSPSEAENVALTFYGKGYNAFVCTYTTNPLGAVPLKKQPMKDFSRAIRYIRKNSAEFHINPLQIAVCGFSAGGHLCASVCVHPDDIADSDPAYCAVSNRPDAAILAYPVITSGEKAHKDSFHFLLGTDASQAEMDYMSLENHVTAETPPCFLWHTVTDETVPVENSLLFADACRKNGVPFALHIFSEGPHGLSLSNREWADGKFGDAYTYAQIEKTVEKIQNEEITVSSELRQYFMTLLANVPSEREPYPEVAIWPELACCWLDRVFQEKKK